MTMNLSTEVFCSLSIPLLQLISIFSKIKHCLRILLPQIPPSLDSSAAAWLEFAEHCSQMGMDLGNGFLFGFSPNTFISGLEGSTNGNCIDSYA